MKEKIGIDQSSDIYGPNFNWSEIGGPIFSRLGFGRSRLDFFLRKTTPLKAIILLSIVMMPPSEACPPSEAIMSPSEALWRERDRREGEGGMQRDGGGRAESIWATRVTRSGHVSNVSVKVSGPTPRSGAGVQSSSYTLVHLGHTCRTELPRIKCQRKGQRTDAPERCYQPNPLSPLGSCSRHRRCDATNTCRTADRCTVHTAPKTQLHRTKRSQDKVVKKKEKRNIDRSHYARSS